MEPGSDFTKSRRNRGVEREGLRLLLSDRRIQLVDVETKRAIILLLPVGDFGIQTFDAVMTPKPVEPITANIVDQYIDDLTLVEMKTTKKAIRNNMLNGFFFGATEREYAMAEALGPRYMWAFVVLNGDNDYGRPFFVLLPLSEVERRTRAKRVQFQVNFRSDVADGVEEAIFEQVFVDPDEQR
jgi:hypothetical protein